jgi:hypothetical protein
MQISCNFFVKEAVWKKSIPLLLQGRTLFEHRKGQENSYRTVMFFACLLRLIL